MRWTGQESCWQKSGNLLTFQQLFGQVCPLVQQSSDHSWGNIVVINQRKIHLKNSINRKEIHLMASCCSLLNPFLASSLQLPMMWIPTRTILSTWKCFDKEGCNLWRRNKFWWWYGSAHMVTHLLPNSYIEQSNRLFSERLYENLQHLHRQIQCSRILSSCQSPATPDDQKWNWCQIGLQ